MSILNILGIFLFFSSTFTYGNGVDQKELTVGKELFKLKRGVSDVGMNRLRKLLNTEKLIFKAEDLDEINRQGGLYVLITVEPEGFVAIPGVQERENILFNIVCDELMLGIPHKAWLVATFALLCVVVGFSLPRFLPPFLLPRDKDLKRTGQLVTEKDS